MNSVKTNNVFNNCVWIAANKDAQSPIFTKHFHLDTVTDSNIYITGLGYFEAKINDKLITDEKLLPLASDYEERDNSSFYHATEGDFTHRIYYHKYNVTNLLKKGENILTVQLGNGWYRQNERDCETTTVFGEQLKTIFCIDMGNNIRICSDGSETWRNSNITYNNIFVGEVIDNTFLGDAEKRVTILDNTKSLLTLANGVADKVVRIIKPIIIKQDGNKTIFDCGENITGAVSLTATGVCGEKIVLSFAENIDDNKKLDFLSTGSFYGVKSGGQQLQSDTFILNDGKNFFEPKFIWHAFRYFEVLGDFDDITVKVIHSNTPVISTFNSDSEALNFLYDAFIRSQLGNMHGSYPSDCPHRERLGYTGDGQIASRAAMYILDSKAFYEKWIQDILDCQDSVNGQVRHTAPYMGGGGGPVGWGGAIVVVPYNYYKIYGETDIIKKTLPSINKWIDYIKSRTENGLIAYETKGAWFLGDWCTLDETSIPADFVNTCLFMNLLLKCAEMAKVISIDESAYIELYEEYKRAVVEHCFDGKQYCGGIQGANAYAVYAGITFGNPLNTLKEQYQNKDCFDTGFIGTDVLLEVLFANDCTDIAYRLLSSDKPGSFLYMKNRGATTLWESWDGSHFDNFSHNHPMFGGCARQIFESILGINQSHGECGFNNITISPKTPKDMNFAEGSIVTVNGEVYLKWQKNDNTIKFEIKIPENIKAEFNYNSKNVKLLSGYNVFEV